MANNFMTVDRAKKEIEKLHYYINLVEGYQPKSIEEQIVKEYALAYSIPKVTSRLNVSHEKVVDVISSLGKDELHKMVRSAYMKKTRHSRGYELT